MDTFVAQVIGKVGDDTGADTLRRFFAQIEYTAFWCIRMLISKEGISAVVPEGYEDVTIERGDYYELHQVKTRDESAGPWTCAEYLPILAKQFVRSRLLPKACRFCFVSNGLADNSTKLSDHSYGALYRLKCLLDAQRGEVDPTVEELRELIPYLDRVCPRLLECCENEDGSNEWQLGAVAALLHTAHVYTDCQYLHFPNVGEDYCYRNLQELTQVSNDCLTSGDTISGLQLLRAYQRLILLIESRIRTCHTFADRAIRAEHVRQCIVPPVNSHSAQIQWDEVPGNNLLEKKAHLGAFPREAIQLMSRQQAAARNFRRELEETDTEEFESLAMTLLDCQHTQRLALQREGTHSHSFGPTLLGRVRAVLPEVKGHHFRLRQDLNDHVCLGVLWDETNACHAFWHSADAEGRQ